MKKFKKKLGKMIPGLVVVCLLLCGVGAVVYNNRSYETIETHAAETNNGLTFGDGFYKTDNLKIYASSTGSATIHLGGGSSLVEYYTNKYGYSGVEIQARSYNSQTKKWSAWSSVYGSGVMHTGTNKWNSHSFDGLYDIGKKDTKVEFKVYVRGWTAANRKGSTALIDRTISFNISRDYKIFTTKCSKITLSGETYSNPSNGQKTYRRYSGTV